MSPIALECRGLVKRYGDVVAVDALDLAVRQGECFGLLGPNGAGKTTTVEIFEGLLEPDAGEVRVLQEAWSGRPRGLRERLGIQLQEAQFTDNLSVLETIALFRSFYRNGSDPREVLGLVGLEEKAKAWVRKLSGGQKQRLSLACALVADPEVLFLDEPTTGLDPQSRRKTWEVVAERRARGTTVLLTTHYMEEAERLCDRVAIVDHGRVIALGTPKELIATLGAEHQLEIEVEGEVDVARLDRLDEVHGVGRDAEVIRITVDEVHRAVPAVLDELARQQVGLTRMSTHHASLEDVFMSLTGRRLRDG